MKTKKMFSLLLALGLTLCMAINTVASDQVTYEGGGAIPGPAPSMQEQLSKAKSPAAKARIQEREKLAMSRGTARSSTAYNIPSMTYYGQEGGFWCVPASVKMIMKKVDKVTLSQSSLAKAMKTNNSTGTPFFNASDYLQNNSKFYYLGRNRSTSATMKQEIGDSVWYDAPAILCVKFSASTSWPYNMSYYHAVLVTGYTANYGSYRIHDPYIKPYVNSSHSGNYRVSFTDAYNATHSYIYY